MRIPITKKTAAEKIFNELGMSLTDGIRVYINQVVRDRSIPFTPTIRREEIPNEATMAAIRNVESGNYRRITNEELQDMMGL